MLKRLYPYAYADSVFVIDYNKLYNMGYRGIIFDIDNTLVPHGKDSTEQVDHFFQSIQAIGFRTLLLSNNDEARVKRFIKNIDSLYICDAEKPKKEGYIRAVEMMGIRREEALYIGDQIFTDIYGANRSGIDNILVHYIRKPGETKIGIRRHVENVVLFFYNHNRSCRNRLGDILTKENS